MWLNSQGVAGFVLKLGRHGLGLGGNPAEPAKSMDWSRDCISWLKLEGFGRK